FQVLELSWRACPLNEAKAAWVLVDEVAGLQAAWIAQRPPQSLAPAVDNRERVRIVHCRAEIVHAGAVDCGEQEHACQRRDPDVGKFLARIERRLHVHCRRRAGVNLESVGAGHRRAVQQRVYYDLESSRLRLLYPEALKEREFLAFRLANIERETSPRQAVHL